MEDKIKELEDFLDEEDNFLMKLRFYQPFDQENFDRLLILLKNIATETREQDLIPKRLACRLVEIIPGMSGIDTDRFTHEQQIALEDAIDQAHHAIMDCLC